MAFEAFRAEGRAPSGRKRLMAALSIGFHGALLAAGVAYSFWHIDELTPPSVKVTFLAGAPPPPPPPPPPPIPTRVSFSADSLFDFAKDTVRPAGKQALDDFAAQLKGAQFEVIRVTGYTDRIGSRAYNIDLSTRRAEAVKSYLVASAGIPADKIMARGADGEAPVTKPDECIGRQRTPKLIACLQPDRRVDVEVVGSRLQAAPNN